MQMSVDRGAVDEILDIWAHVFLDLKVNLYLAMLNQVIPPLRAICIFWKPEDLVATLKFFHDGIVTQHTYLHYSDIEFESCSGFYPKWKEKAIEIKFEVISLPLPTPIPPAYEVIFLRKERDMQFNDINTFYPQNWDFVFCALLKINEALRGKLTLDLRSIYLELDSNSNEASITFVHNEKFDQQVYDQYQEIFNLATSVTWKAKDGKLIKPKLNVISLSFPQEIFYPKESHLLYARKELI